MIYDEQPQGDAYRPSPYLPTKQHLTYTKDFVTVLLLLVALPWILRELIRAPGSLAKSVSTKVAGV